MSSRENVRADLPLLHRFLRHFRKIGRQGQLVDVLPQPPELGQRVALGQGDELPPLGDGQLGVDQELAGGQKAAVLPAAATGLEGELSLLAGQDGEDLIRFFIIDLPQDDALHSPAHGSRFLSVGPQSRSSKPKLRMRFRLSRQFSLTLTQVSR